MRYARVMVGASLVVLATSAVAPAEEPTAQPKPPEVATPEATKPESPKEAPKASLTGFTQIDFRQGDDAGQKAAVDHEFNIRRVRLTASGKLNGLISYSTTLQGESQATALLDAYVDVSAAPMAKLRIGQYKYDFDVNGRESDAAGAFTDRPWIVNTVAGAMNGTSTASNPASGFRDRGVTVFGDSKDRRVNWGYSLGVFQGAGRASDGNDAFSTVFSLRFLPVTKLRVDAGYLFSNNLAKGDSGKNEYSAWTAGAVYTQAKLTVRGEYYWGRRDRGSVREEATGFYVDGAWAALPRLDLVARYHQLKDERFTTGGDRAHGVDAGVKWYVLAQNRGTYVCVNYFFRDADEGVADGLTLLNDGRGAALKNGAQAKGVLVARLQVQF